MPHQLSYLSRNWFNKRPKILSLWASLDSCLCLESITAALGMECCEWSVWGHMTIRVPLEMAPDHLQFHRYTRRTQHMVVFLRIITMKEYKEKSTKRKDVPSKIQRNLAQASHSSPLLESCGVCIILQRYSVTKHVKWNAVYQGSSLASPRVCTGVWSPRHTLHSAYQNFRLPGRKLPSVQPY